MVESPKNKDPQRLPWNYAAQLVRPKVLEQNRLALVKPGVAKERDTVTIGAQVKSDAITDIQKTKEQIIQDVKRIGSAIEGANYLDATARNYFSSVIKQFEERLLQLLDQLSDLKLSPQARAKALKEFDRISAKLQAIYELLQSIDDVRQAINNRDFSPATREIINQDIRYIVDRLISALKSGDDKVAEQSYQVAEELKAAVELYVGSNVQLGVLAKAKGAVREFRKSSLTTYQQIRAELRSPKPDFKKIQALRMNLQKEFNKLISISIKNEIDSLERLNYGPAWKSLVGRARAAFDAAAKTNDPEKVEEARKLLTLARAYREAQVEIARVKRDMQKAPAEAKTQSEIAIAKFKAYAAALLKGDIEQAKSEFKLGQEALQRANKIANNANKFRLQEVAAIYIQALKSLGSELESAGIPVSYWQEPLQTLKELGSVRNLTSTQTERLKKAISALREFVLVGRAIDLMKKLDHEANKGRLKQDAVRQFRIDLWMASLTLKTNHLTEDHLKELETKTLPMATAALYIAQCDDEFIRLISGDEAVPDIFKALAVLRKAIEQGEMSEEARQQLDFLNNNLNKIIYRSYNRNFGKALRGLLDQLAPFVREENHVEEKVFKDMKSMYKVEGEFLRQLAAGELPDHLLKRMQNIEHSSDQFVRWLKDIRYIAGAIALLRDPKRLAEMKKDEPGVEQRVKSEIGRFIERALFYAETIGDLNHVIGLVQMLQASELLPESLKSPKGQHAFLQKVLNHQVVKNIELAKGLGMLAYYVKLTAVQIILTAGAAAAAEAAAMSVVAHVAGRVALSATTRFMLGRVVAASVFTLAHTAVNVPAMRLMGEEAHFFKSFSEFGTESLKNLGMFVLLAGVGKGFEGVARLLMRGAKPATTFGRALFSTGAFATEVGALTAYSQILMAIDLKFYGKDWRSAFALENFGKILFHNIVFLAGLKIGNLPVKPFLLGVRGSLAGKLEPGIREKMEANETALNELLAKSWGPKEYEAFKVLAKQRVELFRRLEALGIVELPKKEEMEAVILSLKLEANAEALNRAKDALNNANTKENQSGISLIAKERLVILKGLEALGLIKRADVVELDFGASQIVEVSKVDQTKTTETAMPERAEIDALQAAFRKFKVKDAFDGVSTEVQKDLLLALQKAKVKALIIGKGVRFANIGEAALRKLISFVEQGKLPKTVRIYEEFGKIYVAGRWAPQLASVIGAQRTPLLMGVNGMPAGETTAKAQYQIKGDTIVDKSGKLVEGVTVKRNGNTYELYLRGEEKPFARFSERAGYEQLHPEGGDLSSEQLARQPGGEARARQIRAILDSGLTKPSLEGKVSPYRIETSPFSKNIINAYDGENAAGYVQIERNGDTVKIVMIETYPEYKGKGVGEALLVEATKTANVITAEITNIPTQHALQKAWEAGVPKEQIVSAAKNTPLYKIAQRAGFTDYTIERDPTTGTFAVIARRGKAGGTSVGPQPTPETRPFPYTVSQPQKIGPMFFVTALDGSKEIGKIDYRVEVKPDGKKVLIIEDTKTKEEYQKQGVYNNLLAKVVELVKPDEVTYPAVINAEAKQALQKAWDSGLRGKDLAKVFSKTTMGRAEARAGFEAVDVTKSDTQMGSFQVTSRRASGAAQQGGTAPSMPGAPGTPSGPKGPSGPRPTINLQVRLEEAYAEYRNNPNQQTFNDLLKAIFNAGYGRADRADHARAIAEARSQKLSDLSQKPEYKGMPLYEIEMREGAERVWKQADPAERQKLSDLCKKLGIADNPTSIMDNIGRLLMEEPSLRAHHLFIKLQRMKFNVEHARIYLDTLKQKHGINADRLNWAEARLAVETRTGRRVKLPINVGRDTGEITEPLTFFEVGNGSGRLQAKAMEFSMPKGSVFNLRFSNNGREVELVRSQDGTGFYVRDNGRLILDEKGMPRLFKNGEEINLTENPHDKKSHLQQDYVNGKVVNKDLSWLKIKLNGAKVTVTDRSPQGIEYREQLQPISWDILSAIAGKRPTVEDINFYRNIGAKRVSPQSSVVILEEGQGIQLTLGPMDSAKSPVVYLYKIGDQIYLRQPNGDTIKVKPGSTFLLGSSITKGANVIIPGAADLHLHIIAQRNIIHLTDRKTSTGTYFRQGLDRQAAQRIIGNKPGLDPISGFPLQGKSGAAVPGATPVSTPAAAKPGTAATGAAPVSSPAAGKAGAAVPDVKTTLTGSKITSKASTCDGQKTLRYSFMMNGEEVGFIEAAYNGDTVTILEAKTNSKYQNQGIYRRLFTEAVKSSRRILTQVVNVKTEDALKEAQQDGKDLEAVFRKTTLGEVREANGFTRHRVTWNEEKWSFEVESTRPQTVEQRDDR